MGKATAKNCDFDPPETPVERIVRGLKIALEGEKAAIKAGKGNDFTKQLEEMIFCAQAAETMRALNAKYATEIEAIESHGGEVEFVIVTDPQKPDSIKIEFVKNKTKNTYPFDPRFLQAEAAKFSKKGGRKHGQKNK